MLSSPILSCPIHYHIKNLATFNVQHLVTYSESDEESRESSVSDHPSEESYDEDDDHDVDSGTPSKKHGIFFSTRQALICYHDMQDISLLH